VLGVFGALLLGAVVFYVAFTFQRAAETSAAEGRLSAEWGSDKVAPQLPFYIKIFRPLLQGAPLQSASNFWSPEAIEAWRRHLVSSGLGRLVEPSHFVASKFWMLLSSAMFLGMLKLFAQSPPPNWLVFGGPIGAFFLPNLDLSSRRKKRQDEVRLSMPYVVDLLTLSIEAGMDFMGSIAKVVDRAPPSPLIEELSVVLKDIQLGKTRAQALRSLAERLDMAEMSSFVAILVSADSMGASIGTVLRAQSESMRNERLTKAEKLGAQASQKILVPLVFFILPAVMLMIFGPIVLQMVGPK